MNFLRRLFHKAMPKSVILALMVLLLTVQLPASYIINPFTGLQDYYEAVSSADFGDLSDVTITTGASGDIIFRNASNNAWVNLGTGANGQFLTLDLGLPAWATIPAGVTTFTGDTDTPANYAGSNSYMVRVNAGASALVFGAESAIDHDGLTNWAANKHVVLPGLIANVLTDHTLLVHTTLGLFDASGDVDHNATTNYAANQHVVLPGTIANVLSDHTLLAHTTLGLFDASSDTDHDQTTNYDVNKHTDHTAVSVLSAGLITGGGTIDGNQTLTLTEATIESAIDTLGAVQFTGDVEFLEDIDVTWADAADRMRIVQGNAAGIEAQALIYINDDRIGTTANEPDEATMHFAAEGPNSWSIYVADAKVQWDGDVLWSWADAADHAVIQQSAVAGTEGQSLIFINDDRTGATANSKEEATIRIDADGTYALYLEDGSFYNAQSTDLMGAVGIQNVVTITHDNPLSIGTSYASFFRWTTNGAQDDFLQLSFSDNVSATKMIFMLGENLAPSGMTDHANYEPPNIVWANTFGADANDYAGVVLGERTQNNVLVAHYFDFYAMTGSIDGTPDVNATELAAIFRFGASGSATPGYSTTPGDVLFEGSVEIDGNVQHAGYNRHDMVVWIDCFDHGSTAAKYGQDWDIASLNTQGGGTNTIQTTPSYITLTTDANGVGDNEGTRADYAIVKRTRLPRMEFSVKLGQTANTQFYAGWNDDGLNAMVAAADKYVIVFFDISDNANWQIKVGDGSTEDVFTSGVAADTNQVIHEIWAEADGTVHWRVNGTELDITGSVDNVMQADAHYLIVGQAQSVTGAAAIVAEICFVEFEKTKAD